MSTRKQRRHLRCLLEWWIKTGNTRRRLDWVEGGGSRSWCGSEMLEGPLGGDVPASWGCPGGLMVAPYTHIPPPRLHMQILRATGEDSVPRLSPIFRWFTGNPWHSLACSWVILYPHLHTAVCISFLSFCVSTYRETTLVQYNLIFITSAKTLFPNRVTFTTTEGQDLNIFWGDTIQPTTISKNYDED